MKLPQGMDVSLPGEAANITVEAKSGSCAARLPAELTARRLQEHPPRVWSCGGSPLIPPLLLTHVFKSGGVAGKVPPGK